MGTRIGISSVTSASLTLFLTLLLVACGSRPAVESNPTPTPGPGTIPAATYTATFTAADNIQVGPSLMTGSVVLTFVESGDFTVRAPEALIVGRYTVTGDQVIFDEGDGSFPCADEPIYVYGWKSEDDKPTFSVVEDACHPRTLAMTLKPYVKEE